MSFNTIPENKILTKISECTVCPIPFSPVIIFSYFSLKPVHPILEATAFVAGPVCFSVDQCAYYMHNLMFSWH